MLQDFFLILKQTCTFNLPRAELQPGVTYYYVFPEASSPVLTFTMPRATFPLKIGAMAGARRAWARSGGLGVATGK